VRLILASASPRRADLLVAAGFHFDVRPVDVDERPIVDERPRDYVRRLALEKARACVAVGPDEVVLAADTVVVVGDLILGKPADEAEAHRMLTLLAGRDHEVLTGVALRLDGREVQAVESTRVWFGPLSAEQVTWYVASGESRGKAGAYAVQGLASRFVERVDGSYPNVVGLPVATVCRLMDELGIAPDEVWTGPVAAIRRID
jgi:septum formation protein